jgi:subtilisin family serine protease
VALILLQTDSQTEFAEAEVLQTQSSKSAGEAEDQDDSTTSHGTMVASKALGRKYGVAKKATLISIKVKSGTGGPKTSDFIEGLDLAVEDLASKSDRHSKTVIISSLGLSNQAADADLMVPLFKRLFDMGIPFVSSAGNLGELIPEINKLPKTLEGPDMPIIVVGAADNNRNKAPYSQIGPHLTLYAPGGLKGFQLQGQSKENKVERSDSGTSFGTLTH